jgi:pimeloyl-ACP methyl ester carboxylesterase
MVTFVLVHGAWHGGWSWKRVRPLLTGRGYDVFTPTLTGNGDRSHLASRDVGLEIHIIDVLNVPQWEELSDVVLCGHSYGGMVISGVADRVPERIRSLVYVDAFVPLDGQSIMDQLPPEGANRVREGARTVGDGWRIPPISAASFKDAPENQEWVDRQSVPQPLRTFEEKIRLTGGIDRITKRTFILATTYQPSPFHASRSGCAPIPRGVSWRSTAGTTSW